MIRSAFALGLHTDPHENQSLSAIEGEMHKRVWWGCVCLDRTLSMKLGRPTCIILDDALNEPYPSDVDDQYITENAAIPRQPSHRPSQISFFVHTARMASVNDNILSTLYFKNRKSKNRLDMKLLPYPSEHSTVISDTVHLDGQLRAWWDNLPTHLKVDPEIPDNADFARQRSVILIRYMNMRTLLHRAPFLILCKQHIADGFLKDVAIASSRLCISVANEIIQFINAQYQRQLLNSLWYNLHCKLLPD